MAFASMRDLQALKERVAELEARIQAMETFHKEGNGDKKIEAVPSIVEALEHEKSLEEVFDPKISGLLRSKYQSVDAVRAASDEDLVAISGIGVATVRHIREVLEEV